MDKDKILVSGCLMGQAVRYDGASKGVASQWLKRWTEEGRVVTICPEVAGGLAVPRAPAEIRGGTGRDVLEGKARLVTESGEDVTEAFVAGARRALEVVERKGIRWALLKAKSPSCGSSKIYDGSFGGVLRSGQGVTAALLRAKGVEVFSEAEIEALAKRLGDR